MKKIILVLSIILAATITKAQTKLFTLEFEHGAVYINQSNGKETYVIQPVTGFYCDKNVSIPTFSFSSGNTNRVLQYSQINTVRFEGVTYTVTTAALLSDTIDGYLRRWSGISDVASPKGNTIEHVELTGTDTDIISAGEIYGIHVSGTADAAYDVDIDGVTISYDHAQSLFMPDINTVTGGAIQSEITISLTAGSIIITKIK